jgi:tRNA A37 threonylcarbamoyladenosine dehydratase
VVDDDRDPLSFVANEWPVDTLSEKSVTVVGVGSIGSAAVETLAAAGVGRIALVDHDRLEQRNLARHRLGPSQLGR